MARPDIELRPGEIIIHDGAMNRVVNKMNIQGGSAYLTNQRFMRFKQSTGMQLLIGLFALLFKDKPDFEVELGNIQSITRGKQGLNKNVIMMTLNDGVEYKLVCNKFDQWMQGFADAYDSNGRFSFNDLGSEQWAIQSSTQTTV